MLEMKFFISTYFKTPELQIAARQQLSGLYCSENLFELLLVIHRRTSLINEWLQDNRGHEHSSEYSQEYTHYGHFERAVLSARLPRGAPQPFPNLRFQHSPHPIWLPTEL